MFLKDLAKAILASKLSERIKIKIKPSKSSGKRSFEYKIKSVKGIKINTAGPVNAPATNQNKSSRII